MTTFILLSNLNWAKMLSGPAIVLSTIAAPGEAFLYLFVLSPCCRLLAQPFPSDKKKSWLEKPSLQSRGCFCFALSMIYY